MFAWIYGTTLQVSKHVLSRKVLRVPGSFKQTVRLSIATGGRVATPVRHGRSSLGCSRKKEKLVAAAFDAETDGAWRVQCLALRRSTPADGAGGRRSATQRLGSIPKPSNRLLDGAGARDWDELM
ncbi:uncharacterized protein TrAtP1_007625 [Trichoderma atroviride]|uniref:uncharacterized protein n=1 Tax=Hypocrea atroviridis TaxID=63577 RepID=UPI00333390BA|nr:hypothetical protein TrAtP1_007625 [Trichoderma atroviride]